MKFKGDVLWRAMTGFDLGDVGRIAGVVHPGFFESPEVLAERQQLYRDGAYLLEIGDRPTGYVLSHPWRFGDAPALNATLGSLPPEPDTYYLHDLAILPVARRIGAASYIVAALEKHARAKGFPSMTLIAVNQSRPFWERHGFAPLELPGLTEKLLSYEPEAKMMAKPLT
jgi:GNAT superfamily N-acetyltransferase